MQVGHVPVRHQSFSGILPYPIKKGGPKRPAPTLHEIVHLLERTGAHLLGHNTHRTLCVTGLGQHFQIDDTSGLLHRV